MGWVAWENEDAYRDLFLCLTHVVVSTAICIGLWWLRGPEATDGPSRTWLQTWHREGAVARNLLFR